MDSLRWILLLLGVLVVAGVYWFSRRGGRPERREPRLAEPDLRVSTLDLDGDEGPRLSLDEIAEVQGPNAEPSFGPSQDGGTAIEEPAPVTGQGSPTEVEEKIVTLYLVAPRGRPFGGPALQAAFDALDLRYGEMDIYHRPGEDSLGRPVFSVANLVEPGTFTPEELPTLSSPGLALFMRLPGPADPLAAFDDLLATARALAERLGGELRGGDRKPLDEAAALGLRGEVAAWAETHAGRLPS